MRFAIVANGVVVNIAEADEAIGEGWIQSDTASIGQLYDGTDFTDPPIPVPTQVTMRQARAALIIAGLHDAVYDAINAIEDEQDRALALNEWERSQVVERNRGLVVELAAAIGLSESQLDDLFIFAASIP